MLAKYQGETINRLNKSRSTLASIMDVAATLSQRPIGLARISERQDPAHIR
jgi:hypothetical protein